MEGRGWKNEKECVKARNRNPNGGRTWKNQESGILRSTSKISTRPQSITNESSAWKKNIGGLGELFIYPTAISISLSSIARNIRGESITLVSKSIASKKSRKLPTRKPKTTPTEPLRKAGLKMSKATASTFPSTAGRFDISAGCRKRSRTVHASTKLSTNG